MKNATIALVMLFTHQICHSQNDPSSELLIHYSNDRSIVLRAQKKVKSNLDSTVGSTSETSIDSLLEYYTVQLEFTLDTLYFQTIENHLNLDSTTFSELIVKAGLRMMLVKYGYAGAKNYDDLTLKYGVKYSSGGCTYSPHEIERQYARYMQKLLTIRNGQNWEEEYNKAVQKKN